MIPTESRQSTQRSFCCSSFSKKGVVFAPKTPRDATNGNATKKSLYTWSRKANMGRLNFLKRFKVVKRCDSV
ncbi:hypothetical protein OESDEN_08835 [Oesophagostomum dentatum]|uniref:Uncharacterized protein n=1 Tax=Oesophagostomum dentatum TaxID=61180 RepID=A0A0B1T179_OESDE|nr:hypothetical protein OESDEN_08835 [Oesophagostomum dentatum]